MKAVILAGGYGTRISEETRDKPKPLVEIGGKPILWHIMRLYSHYGINDFVICLGYKGYLIKEYIANYYLHTSDVTIDLSTGELSVHNNSAEPWKVTLIDTGSDVMTGGRIKRIAKYVKDEESFCLTYGDGLSDVNLQDVLTFHKSHGKLATVTAVQPAGRFGQLSLNDNSVASFLEKPRGDGGYINGGFFVLSPKIMDYIEGDTSTWEKEPLERLASEGQLQAFKCKGFWLAMDTLRDKNTLEELWAKPDCPWRK